MRPTQPPTRPPNQPLTQPPRHLLVLRGHPDHTAAQAAAAVAHLPPAEVFWFGAAPPPGIAPQPTRGVRARLGQDAAAVVLDLHAGLDADRLAQSQGFVRGGGTLVLRLDPAGQPAPAAETERLAVWPFGHAAVGGRFRARLEARLFDAPELAPPALPLARPPTIPHGSAEQAALASRLAARLAAPHPTVTVLTADRGRGKSSALGLALAALAQHHPAPRIIVTALEAEAVGEVLRFAQTTHHETQTPTRQTESTRSATTHHEPAHAEPAHAEPAHAEPAHAEPAHPSRPPLQHTALADLLTESPGSPPGSPPTVIIIDEAAQVPVPLLKRLVSRWPAAHLVFASTVHGYEGTGRGFALRFVPWLGTQPRPVLRETLRTPIRWAEGDGLERRVFDALLLDAEPADLNPTGTAVRPESLLPLHCARADRDALAADEAQLRAVFGLLIQAHYRTTPSDLHRLLDAPNLSVWIAQVATPGAAANPAPVVGACLLATEGGLTPALIAEAASGQARLRGHALADALVSHLGAVEAGALHLVRSVRIASHPALRRQHIAHQLAEHIHTARHTPAPDAFGTLFGATPEVIAFRRTLGYEIVRLSASRGSRTGEPAVLMLRPETPAAHALVRALRARLARDLPLQLQLMQADEELLLDPALASALTADLPPPEALTPAEIEAGARTYAWGPGTFEAAAPTVCSFCEAHPDRIATLPAPLRAVLTARVIERRGWAEAVRRSGLPSHAAAMRALRRAVRGLLEPV